MSPASGTEPVAADDVFCQGSPGVLLRCREIHIIDEHLVESSQVKSVALHELVEDG